MSGSAASVVQVVDQFENIYRIHVKNRLRPSCKALRRIITGHNQQIFYSRPCKRVQFTFQRIPVFVFACKMNNLFYPKVLSFNSQGHRQNRRLASRVVCNAYPVDSYIFCSQFGHLNNALLSFFPCSPPGHQLPGDRQSAGLCERLSK